MVRSGIIINMAILRMRMISPTTSSWLGLVAKASVGRVVAALARPRE